MRSRDCSPPGVHNEAHFLVFVPMVHGGGVRAGKQTAPNAGVLKKRAGCARWPAEPARVHCHADSAAASAVVTCSDEDACDDDSADDGDGSDGGGSAPSG